MNLGASFESLISSVRAEIGLSGDLGHGIGDEDRIKRAINRAYEEVYRRHPWPLLKRTFPRVTMAAGQRFYDPPTSLKIEHISDVRVWWSGQPTPLERGIGTAERAMFNETQRSDPPLRWDIQYYDTPSDKAMIEVWPTPASAAAAIEFEGTFTKTELTGDADLCLVDSECVILFAAAYAGPKDERDARLSDAEKMFLTTTGRMAPGERVRMGLGDANRMPSGRAVVRVA